MNLECAHLFECCGFIARNGGVKRLYPLRNALCLLRNALFDCFDDLRYLFFRKLVEGVFRATDLVEHAHHVARSAAKTLAVYSLARAAYSPTAVVVLAGKHGSISVLLAEFFHKIFERGFDLIKFFKHIPSPFWIFNVAKNLRRILCGSSSSLRY